MKHGHAFKQSTSTSRFAETALSWFYRTLCSRLCSMFPPKRSPHGHEHTQRKCRALVTDAPLQVQEARGGILINIIRNESHYTSLSLWICSTPEARFYDHLACASSKIFQGHIYYIINVEVKRDTTVFHIR